MERLIFSVVGIVAAFITPSVALACDQPIVLTNWKSCAVGPLSENEGMADWNAVPSWAKDDKISPFFFDEPRMLALHGLCNTKFKRVVMCLPGWQETRDKNACWYLICSGYQAANK